MLHGQAVAHPVTDAVNSLAAAVDSQNTAEIASSCRTLRPLLDAAELDNRKLAATAGAFPLLLRAADATSTAADARAAALLALAALLRGQPDLVTPPQPNEIIPDGTANANVQHLVRLLRESVNSLKQQSRGESKTEVEAACGALRAVRHACTLHEANRQGSVTAGVVPLFVEALSAGAVPASGESASSSSSSSSASPTPDDQQVVREAARALRVLTYDDDIRVAFGKGHEHARLVVGEHGALPALVAALRGHLADGETVTELCNTLARLAVRNEFCQEIVDLGGLTLVLDAMHAHAEHLSVLAASLGLLRAIAGNDDVKARIRAAGGLADIVAALTQHVTDAREWEGWEQRKIEVGRRADQNPHQRHNTPPLFSQTLRRRPVRPWRPCACATTTTAARRWRRAQRTA